MKKVKDAYAKRAPIDPTKLSFQHANLPVQDATQMRHLNHMNDNIIVLTAHENTKDQPTLTLSRPTLGRTPLQPINTQLPANPNPLGVSSDFGERLVKVEPAYSSPFEFSENTPRVTDSAGPASSSRHAHPPAVKNDLKEEEHPKGILAFAQYGIYLLSFKAIEI